VVEWALVQPVVDLAAQAARLRWPILGTIGDTGHLRKHGDHTPWSRGKKLGFIYAIDLDAPADFKAFLVRVCRSDYDTTWIDFWNMGGQQFDNAGNVVASSGDSHLHISVANGFERKHVSLLNDYEAAKSATPQEVDDMAGRGDDIYTLLHDGKRAGPAQTAGGGVPIAWIVREFAEIGDALAVVVKGIDKLAKDLEVVKAELAQSRS
jgi:hypothetical protein